MSIEVYCYHFAMIILRTITCSFFLLVATSVAAAEIVAKDAVSNSAFLRILENPPDTLVGILIGALFSTITTITAVFMTNRANARQLSKQFYHESKTRRADREYQVRKSIYLDAMEALAKGMETLGAYADLKQTTDEISAKTLAGTATIDKTHLVASQPTIEAISNLTTQMALVKLRLVQTRLGLDIINGQIRATSEVLEGRRVKQAQMLELMRQLNLARDRDRERFLAAQDDFDFQTKQIADYEKEKAELTTALLSKTTEFVPEIYDELLPLYRISRDVVLKMREELGLPLDNEFYIRMSDQNAALARSAGEEFLAEMQSVIKSTAASEADQNAQD